MLNPRQQAKLAVLRHLKGTMDKHMAGKLKGGNSGLGIATQAGAEPQSDDMSKMGSVQAPAPEQSMSNPAGHEMDPTHERAVDASGDMGDVHAAKGGAQSFEPQHHHESQGLHEKKPHAETDHDDMKKLHDLYSKLG